MKENYSARQLLDYLGQGSVFRELQKRIDGRDREEAISKNETRVHSYPSLSRESHSGKFEPNDLLVLRLKSSKQNCRVGIAASAP